MASPRLDPEVLAHLEWLGFVRPTGLVVSAPALVRAGAILDRRDAEGQRLLRACAVDRTFDPKDGTVPHVPDFRAFAESVLGWSFSPRGYAGTAESPIPPELEVPLPDYGETLRPDFAVRELEPKEGAPAWQLLVRAVEPGEDLDRVVRAGGQLEASAHGRMERLLRQTGVPAGLLFNGRALRLLSAPRGESSGWLDFRVAEMVQTAGRPISTALRLLLGQPRLLSLPRAQRLAALLEDSRKFQNEVSERLAQQVLHALYELLRGFQAAHDASKGKLLREQLAEHPDEVYRALLTVILRLVFLLYAEERDMLPEDETFLRYYSLAGLYERLREDAALFPDTMDQRFGAWAQLLVLFRLIHDGADAGAMRLPKRHGVLFDPDRFKFLEGRPIGGARQMHERIEPPLVPDGTIYRALEKLLILDGERISYRALDVEQIGSVYETMMGFRLETATGRSVAIKAQKKQGAPTAVDLEALLGEPATKRDKWLETQADRKLTDTVKKATAGAATLEDLHSALLPVIDGAATPDLVPKGAMVLQPSEERRRSGSHYTPRALTEPIVRTTLEPILARLRGADGRPPRPAQILDLKVCDPAMGSGAFLVEACRQLGDALVEAWHAHGEVPAVPPDEDEVIFARRLIAQRCLYGVDRNPVAVDLAKVSLWLVTLAKDHALTFVDHALRHGDSLVGLSRKQIEAFHWEPDAPRFQAGFETMQVREHVAKVAALRQRIREAEDNVSDYELRDLWDEAQLELGKARLFGDLVLAAFFEGEKPKEREAKRSEYASAVVSGEAERYRGWLEEWRHADQPLAPFHWEVEFPEVFERENPGFDGFVGNPPFMGGQLISGANGVPYFAWLTTHYAPAAHYCDLVAYFFRRAFALLCPGGTLGLIATSSIAVGDTRNGGLLPILKAGGEIYRTTRRLPWPGRATVIVSILNIIKGHYDRIPEIDGRRCERISAFLKHLGPDDDPQRLGALGPLHTEGSKIYGQGFLFDDNDEQANPLKLRDEILAAHPELSSRIYRYIGGSELVNSPTHMPRRWVIFLSDLRDEVALKPFLPLVAVVREKVKPYRDSLADTPVNRPLKRRWWAYQAHRPEFYEAIKEKTRVLAASKVSAYLSFAFLPTGIIYSQKLIVLNLDCYASFGALQSRVHEEWVRFCGGTRGDGFSYTPSDCFETFPFPENWETRPTLEADGKAYYEFRAALMVRNDEGLTKIYNRFHDPDERDPEIVKLRELHAAIDRAVLDAYGWSDIPTDCKFLLDYEIDEDEWGDKKKPYRYRWPDEVRDEVLARLLELNAERAKEEARSSAAATKKQGKKASAKRAPKESDTEDLFS
ncbi:MAG: class I SAM-dependent DNA methyltransferase [Gemmatimonadetes bacterium]|nr:class I SAM-dependent DNA methyltransferase [Gemmatimonadota bacterium]